MHIEFLGPEGSGKTTFIKHFTAQNSRISLNQEDAWIKAKIINKSHTNLSSYDRLVSQKILYWGDLLNDNFLFPRQASENIAWYNQLTLMHAVITKNIRGKVVLWDEGIIHNNNFKNNSYFCKELSDKLKFKLFVFMIPDIDENHYYRKKRRNSGYLTSRDSIISDKELLDDCRYQSIEQKSKFRLFTKLKLPVLLFKNSYSLSNEQKSDFLNIAKQLT